jgi:hypothetical protein
MAKYLWQSTRIHVYGGDENEKRAFALIGYSGTIDNDSVVTMVRGKVEELPKLIKRFGNLTDDDVQQIMALEYKQSIWLDECSMVVRLA